MSNQVGDCFKFLWPFQNVRTLTDSKMQYLATNVRRNLGFHLPWDDRTDLDGVHMTRSDYILKPQTILSKFKNNEVKILRSIH